MSRPPTVASSLSSILNNTMVICDGDLGSQLEIDLYYGHLRRWPRLSARDWPVLWPSATLTSSLSSRLTSTMPICDGDLVSQLEIDQYYGHLRRWPRLSAQDWPVMAICDGDLGSQLEIEQYYVVICALKFSYLFLISCEWGIWVRACWRALFLWQYLWLWGCFLHRCFMKAVLVVIPGCESYNVMPLYVLDSVFSSFIFRCVEIEKWAKSAWFHLKSAGLCCIGQLGSFDFNISLDILTTVTGITLMYQQEECNIIKYHNCVYLKT